MDKALGPVHPDTLCPELFDDVLTASTTGQVLAFDKIGAGHICPLGTPEDKEDPLPTRL
ncbi:MAG: hypothetical protein ACRDTD_10505 [Pseudonocardiaceae bacterium]